MTLPHSRSLSAAAKSGAVPKDSRLASETRSVLTLAKHLEQHGKQVDEIEVERERPHDG